MNKSKLNWVLYTGEMFDVYVTLNLIKRLHAPLEPDLEYVTSMQCRCLHLRPCAVGLNKDGKIAAWLYCTFSGRFFDRGKDGWNEEKINFNPNKPSLKNGKSHSDYPKMRQFGGLCCHLLVAYAWRGARPEGMVCDHLDTNILNLNADNLEWVFVPENNRRADIAKRMRKAGIDPKRLTPTLMRGIYSLPTEDDWVGVLIGVFWDLCHRDSSQMTIEAIRRNVAKALDALHRL